MAKQKSKTNENAKELSELFEQADTDIVSAESLSAFDSSEPATEEDTNKEVLEDENKALEPNNKKKAKKAKKTKNKEKKELTPEEQKAEDEKKLILKKKRKKNAIAGFIGCLIALVLVGVLAISAFFVFKQVSKRPPLVAVSESVEVNNPGKEIIVKSVPIVNLNLKEIEASDLFKVELKPNQKVITKFIVNNKKVDKVTLTPETKEIKLYTEFYENSKKKPIIRNYKVIFNYDDLVFIYSVRDTKVYLKATYRKTEFTGLNLESFKSKITNNIKDHKLLDAYFNADLTKKLTNNDVMLLGENKLSTLENNAIYFASESYNWKAKINYVGENATDNDFGTNLETEFFDKLDYGYTKIVFKEFEGFTISDEDLEKYKDGINLTHQNHQENPDYTHEFTIRLNRKRFKLTYDINVPKKPQAVPEYKEKLEKEYTYKYGESVELINGKLGLNLPRHEFLGWTTILNPKVDSPIFDGTILGDTVLKPVFKQVIFDITINHYIQSSNFTEFNFDSTDKILNANLGAVDLSGKIKNFEEYELTEESQNLVNNYVLTSETSTHVINLYYKYKKVTITFNLNGGKAFREVDGIKKEIDINNIPEFQVLHIKQKLPSLDVLKITIERPGYRLNQFLNNGQLIKFGETEVAGDINIEVTWIERNDTDYTVKHFLEKRDGNGFEIFEVENLKDKTLKHVTANIKKYDPLAPSTYKYKGIKKITNSDEMLDGEVLADGSLELKVYYERNKHKIIFNVEGGTPELSDVFTRFGAVIEEFDSSTISKDKKIFKHWSFTPGGEKINFPFEMPNETVYVFAVWEQGVFDINISYYQESKVGDFIIQSKKVVKEVPVGTFVVPVPNVEGFDLAYETKQLIVNYQVTTDTLTHKIDVKYERKIYTVTYVIGDDAEFTFNINHHNEYTKVKFEGTPKQYTATVIASKEGYNLLYWSKSEGGTKYNFDEPIYGDLKLYAVWEPKNNISYHIEYYQQELNDLTQYKKVQDLVKTGVAGEIVNVDILSYQGFEAIHHQDEVREAVLQGNGETVLKLFYNRRKYTLTYATYGATNVEDKIEEKLFGADIARPNINPEKQYFSFKHWSEKQNGSEFAFNKKMPAKDFVIHAVYNRTHYEVTIVLKKQNLDVDLSTHYSMSAIEKKYFEIPLNQEITLEESYRNKFLDEGFVLAPTSTLTHTVDEADYQSFTIVLHYNRIVKNINYHINAPEGEFTWNSDLIGGINNYPEYAKVRYGNPAKRYLGSPAIRTHWAFKHWSLTSDGTDSPYDFSLNVTEDIDLYAIWTSISGATLKYFVSYRVEKIDNPNEYDIWRDVTLQCGSGTLVHAEILDIPGFTKKTENLPGDYLESDTVVSDGSTKLIIYYKRNKHDVYFDTKGGSPNVAPLLGVPFGQAVNKPSEIPVIENKEFDYWAYDEEGHNRVVGFDYGKIDMPDKPLTLYAIYRLIKFDYKVNIYLESISPSGTFNLETTKSFVATKGGNQIPRSLYEEYLSNGFEFLPGTITTVYTQYDPLLNVVDLKFTRKIYKISFDPVKGKFNNLDPNNVNHFIYLKFGEKISEELKNESYAPMRNYCDFKYWALDGETTELDYQNYTISGDTTLKAVWKINKAFYEVKYFLQKVEGADYVHETGFDKKILGNVSETVNAEVLDFPGFEVTGTPSGQVANMSGVVLDDDSLVLNVYYNRKTITVKYDLKGGNILGETEYPQKEVRFGAKVPKPENPAKEGYEFKGFVLKDNVNNFNFDEALTNPSTFTDLEIEATWLGNETNYKVFMKYEKKDGSFEPELLDTGIHRGRAGEEIPIKINHAIDEGFMISPSSPMTIQLSHIESENVVHIEFIRIKFSVKFYEDSINNIVYDHLEQMVKFDLHASLPETPTRYGYKFKYWSENPNGGVQFNFGQIPIKRNIRLYAFWEEENFTLRLNLDGGTLKDEAGVDQTGEVLITLPFTSFPIIVNNPRKGKSITGGKDNQMFVKWVDTITGEEVKLPFVAKNAHLKAVWQKAEFKEMFGSYPKSKVSDLSLLTKLNELYAKTSWQAWHSIFDLVGMDGFKNQRQIYERFAGISSTTEKFLRVERKVRVMRTYEYNKLVTFQANHNESALQNQDYIWETVYYNDERFEKRGDNWYKYEPIKWRKVSATTSVLAQNQSATVEVNREIYMPEMPLDKITFAPKINPLVQLSSGNIVLSYLSYNASYLRSFLNYAFLAKAFNAAERTLIAEYNHKVDNVEAEIALYPENVYSARTTEKVFVLSKLEFNKLLDTEKQFDFTSLGIGENTYYDETYPTSFFLRTLFDSENIAKFSKDGTVTRADTTEELGIVPAICIIG